MMEKKLFKEKEISEIYGISVWKLRNDRFKGIGFPYVRITRTIRYDLKDVEAYIEGCKIQKGGPHAD